MAYKKPVYINRGRKNFSDAVPILLFLLLAIILAAGIALVWQHQQEKGKQLLAQSNSSSSSSLPAVIESKESSSSSITSDSESASSNSQQSTESGSNLETVVTADQVVFGEPIPESSRVKSEYFDDALFIGDSISQGIELYQMMDNATVLADRGLNPQTIFTKAVVKDASGNEVTVVDALKDYQPQKVYVMLGANGLGWLNKDQFISDYSRLVDVIKQTYPNAKIYIQSVLPVTQKYEDEKPEMANSKIDDYNAAILSMTKDKQVYYVNVAEAFKDDTGALPDDASPKDGMHFGAEYYQKWFDYLKTHTVQ